ncbi:AbrB family transcriptional regulator [Lactiplantibacillus fabifermentans T30PCM01]|uniref:AbrB family transcriptional regulator n=1 Tax=Lactiplantibacillus fabifermentans T30PCM01 TaxID=1400520 RepID=W6T435_9LACO|nr:AbrB/MazE/SpoVT family DNA-binding domain-containing protein [Lactiplantibacillus fabifermentans]ETY72569.1 AbrB family transcriptional regulator [Lactiplantibacillus fabifermentans T30PCM01]
MKSEITGDQTTYTVKVSSQGQFTIPIALRRELDIQSGDELIIKKRQNNQLSITTKPTAADWRKVIAGIPFEEAILNEDGTVNAEKSPFLARWIQEDQGYDSPDEDPRS